MKLFEACDILGVPPHELSVETVKKSFKVRSLKVHPDRGGTSGDFIRTKNAESFLLDYLDNRPNYDELGAQALGLIIKGILKARVVQRALTATLSQAMNAEIYPFVFENQTFLVPLWERRSVFHLKTGMLVIDVNIEFPAGVLVENDNTLVLETSLALCNLLERERLEFLIGDYTFNVDLEHVRLLPSQTILLSEEGIPRPGSSLENSDLLQLAPVYLHLHIV